MEDNLTQYNKKQFTSILNKNKHVMVAYLFGSYAKNREREDSDLDIVIVLNSLFNFDYSLIYDKISSFFPDKNLDLRVIIPKETSPLFLFQIVKSGICLFEKSKEQRLQFETYALKMYYDSQHLRDVYNYYLDKRFANHTYGR